MTVEREHCFDPVTQMNCNPTRASNPLRLNRTVFFAVQPKYLNVDIRIILDVTKGGQFAVVGCLSQGSVAKRLRCGGIFIDHSITTAKAKGLCS